MALVEPERPRSRTPRRVALAAAAVIATALAVGLALFQPWKLWVDDEVDEAAPVGAVPITATTAPPPSVVSTTAAPAPATVPEATVPATTVAPATTVPPTTVPPIPVGGQFVGIDHGTTGAVALLQDATGVQFVRLENLDTSNGPDLFVYLSANPSDGPEGAFDDDYVNLGRLQGNVGSQNYVIPAGTDLARYVSVVIWCDRFNSAFGAAPLT